MAADFTSLGVSLVYELIHPKCLRGSDMQISPARYSINCAWIAEILSF